MIIKAYTQMPINIMGHIEPRHCCSYCKKKRIRSKMTRLYISLINKKIWVCSNHVNHRELGDYIIRF